MNIREDIEKLRENFFNFFHLIKQRFIITRYVSRTNCDCSLTHIVRRLVRGFGGSGKYETAAATLSRRSGESSCPLSLSHRSRT